MCFAPSGYLRWTFALALATGGPVAGLVAAREGAMLQALYPVWLQFGWPIGIMALAAFLGGCLFRQPVLYYQSIILGQLLGWGLGPVYQIIDGDPGQVAITLAGCLVITAGLLFLGRRYEVDDVLGLHMLIRLPRELPSGLWRMWHKFCSVISS